MSAHIPVDDDRVRSELTRYLDDNRHPIIEKDVDGSNSLPLEIDRDNPNFGRYSACRRVSRTIYPGSAPITRTANRGLEDRRVKLGRVKISLDIEADIPEGVPDDVVRTVTENCRTLKFKTRSFESE